MYLLNRCCMESCHLSLLFTSQIHWDLYFIVPTKNRESQNIYITTGWVLLADERDLASDMLIIRLNIVSERSKCDELIYSEKHHLEMYNILVTIYIYIISVFFWDNILVVWLLLYWPDYKTTPPYFKMYLFEKDFENQILCFTEKNKQTFFRKLFSYCIFFLFEFLFWTKYR